MVMFNAKISVITVMPHFKFNGSIVYTSLYCATGSLIQGSWLDIIPGTGHRSLFNALHPVSLQEVTNQLCLHASASRYVRAIPAQAFASYDFSLSDQAADKLSFCLLVSVLHQIPSKDGSTVPTVCNTRQTLPGTSPFLCLL